MKKIILCLGIVIVGFLGITSCSKSKGNYSYQEVNKLTVVDLEGNDISNQNYDIRLGKEFRIQVKASGTLSKDDQSSLHYYWIIDKDTISEKNELVVKTNDLGVGNKIGKLVVVDKQTGLSYSSNFRIRITAGISKGSFILTEDEAFNTTLVLRDLSPEEDYIFIKQLDGGLVFGKYPLGLDISYRATSSTNREYKRAVVSTKEGANVIVVVDLNSFLPTLLYPKIGSTLGGEELTPSYVWCNPRRLQSDIVDGITLMNGKCYNISSGLVGTDIYRYDLLNYDFGKNAVAPSLALNGFFIAGYDHRNERIRIFGNNLKGGGMFTMDYDNLVNPEMTKGHTFITAAEMYTTDLKWQFLTRKGAEVFMHDAVMNINVYPYVLKEVKTVSNKVVPELVDAIDIALGGQYWYFAKGRTIYQCSTLGLDILPYLTLPSDGSGDIVSWSFNVDAASTFTKMGIATYNAGSDKNLKGSYYLYNMIDKKYDIQDLNVIDKAVDIEIGL